jgi:hypothetical protein
MTVLCNMKSNADNDAARVCNCLWRWTAVNKISQLLIYNRGCVTCQVICFEPAAVQVHWHKFEDDITMKRPAVMMALVRYRKWMKWPRKWYNWKRICLTVTAVEQLAYIIVGYTVTPASFFSRQIAIYVLILIWQKGYYGAYRTLYIFPCFCFFLFKKVGKLDEFEGRD